MALAVGLLVMMYPILCKVRYESLHRTFQAKSLWIQVAFSLVVNWIVAPLFMVCVLVRLAWECITDGHPSWHWRGHFCRIREG